MAFSLRALASSLRDRTTVYVSAGARDVLVRGSNLVVVGREGDERSVALSRVRRLVLLGKASFCTSVLHRLLREGVPVDWLDGHGRPLGLLFPLDSGDGRVRLAQEAFCTSAGALDLARRVIQAKIDNVCGLIRRRTDVPTPWWAAREKAARATTPEVLRGAEGTAARLYFGLWKEWTGTFSWNGRKAYPAPDPVNLLLSLGYGMLHNRLASALRHYGLDPRQGFFHVGRGTHCALASDLMEDLRFAVDSTVLKTVREDCLSADDFTMKDDRCVIAGSSAFSLVLERFERMFEKEWAFVDGNGTAARMTLNDRIDVSALDFRDHVLDRGEYVPFRRTA